MTMAIVWRTFGESLLGRVAIDTVVVTRTMLDRRRQNGRDQERDERYYVRRRKEHGVKPKKRNKTIKKMM